MDSHTTAVCLAIALAVTVMTSVWYATTHQCADPSGGGDAGATRLLGASSIALAHKRALTFREGQALSASALEVYDSAHHVDAPVGTRDDGDDITEHTRLHRAPSTRTPRVVYIDLGANEADTLIKLSQGVLRHFGCVPSQALWVSGL